MPAPAGTKRVRSTAPKPHRPKNAPADHTRSWKVFVRGVDGQDISYWLKKVQFKLHDTYANSLRMIDGPPFEVEETGWGEFEIAIKFYFVPESTEKPQTVWHGLKLHPYGDDVDGQKERRETAKSVCYEEVLFNEPVEPPPDILQCAYFCASEEYNWSALLQTLEGHSSRVSAVAFSSDSKLLASATVRLWDAGSGAPLQTLEGHGSWVGAVAFFPDSKLLASASGDGTVRLWDAGSGAPLQNL